MNTPRYVQHFGKRYLVLGETEVDGVPGLKLAQVRGGEIVARADDCREDRRRVVIRGYKPHRYGRPVVLDVRQEHGETRVVVRLKGGRAKFMMTLEGLYDTAARQMAANLRLAARHRRRTGRK